MVARGMSSYGPRTAASIKEVSVFTVAQNPPQDVSVKNRLIFFQWSGHITLSPTLFVVRTNKAHCRSRNEEHAIASLVTKQST